MKHTSDWYNAIAHIDADCFYASCELTRRPDLKGKPVCVLSSQDACVVAKTYDAKARGITTGMPAWEAKKLLPEAAFLSADFRFYGQLSEKMFSILRRYSPDIEIYSIDEGFMDMNGIRSMHRKSFREIADHIRHAIFSEVGITVSVGISTTRILAKIASEMNKPDGSTIIPGRRIARFLRDIPVAAVPGIGRNRQQLMKKLGIASAYDFAATQLERIDFVLGKTGVDLWHELNGSPVYSLTCTPAMPKSIGRSASFGAVTRDKLQIKSHLSYHATRVVAELVRQKLTASSIAVFLRLKSFETSGNKVQIRASNDFSRLHGIVMEMFEELFDERVEYRASGVIAAQIQPDVQQGDLFAKSSAHGMMQVMAEVNDRFGAQMIGVAVSLRKPGQKLRFKYPVIYL